MHSIAWQKHPFVIDTGRR